MRKVTLPSFAIPLLITLLLLSCSKSEKNEDITGLYTPTEAFLEKKIAEQKAKDPHFLPLSAQLTRYFSIHKAQAGHSILLHMGSPDNPGRKVGTLVFEAGNIFCQPEAGMPTERFAIKRAEDGGLIFHMPKETIPLRKVHELIP